MSLRAKISPFVTRYLTSDRRLARNREREEKRRSAKGEPHTVHYFHQADDPYSVLTASCLTQLTERFDIRIEPHLVPPPTDAAAPERERLAVYSRRDAVCLAEEFGLSFNDHGRQPGDGLIERSQRLHVAAIERGLFCELAAGIDHAVWQENTGELNSIETRIGKEASLAETGEALQAGEALRERLGHYLGATFYYGGEWYWGLDRLHYLEARLHELGVFRDSEAFAPMFPPPPLKLASAPPASAQTPALEFYASLRSPYTYLAIERTIALAEHYGLRLEVRYVLPMVMRGLPIPPNKRTYIMLDCKREATRLGIDYGSVADPVGRPAERGLAVLDHAIREGREKSFLREFAPDVWARGIDMDSDRNLRRVVERSGLEWEGAQRALTLNQWRQTAVANRDEMFGEQIWGVPAFRFGEFATWGQDRMWLLERAILSQLRGPSDGTRAGNS